MTRQIRSANAEHQILRALIANRRTRNRENAFVVEGVRNINAAFEHGWTVRTVLLRDAPKRSAWATRLAEQCDDTAVLAPELFDALTDRETPPEVLLVVEKRRTAIEQLVIDDTFIGTVLDRPSYPGNIGTILRTCDALGSSALIITGHGADPYDPRSVRASTGSFFAVPIVESPGDQWKYLPIRRTSIYAAESLGQDIKWVVFEPEPMLILFGNETAGLSRALRDGAGVTVSIPMWGTASSLNVAAAHAIVLHEIYRQRHDHADG